MLQTPNHFRVTFNVWTKDSAVEVAQWAKGIESMSPQNMMSDNPRWVQMRSIEVPSLPRTL